MRILLTGAGGFIGAQIAAALRDAGHAVVRGVRAGYAAPAAGAVVCDFSTDVEPEVWLPRLAGIDAVVNCAGILREARSGDFERVHVLAPLALFRACERLGIRRVIQISALGRPDDGEFIRSKHRCDERLAGLDLDWVVIRPSVVYSPRGSYGGTSLLRAMAALPGVMLLPGDGRQLLQPICADDLGRAVVALLGSEACRHTVLEAVGPDRMSIGSFLEALRTWLGLGRALTVRVPLALVRPVALVGELLGRGPLGMTMYRMLQHGNVGAAGGVEAFAQATGVQPRPVGRALAAVPSAVQDRWHAQLYFLGPLLQFTLAVLWIGSGVVGFATPMAEAAATVSALGVPAQASPWLVYGVSALDCLLGVMLLIGWQVPLAGILMLISLLAYTLVIGSALPSAWLEPFGGLLKNLPLIPAVLVMLVLHRRR
ncbi:MAG: SDR family oxidoreductase [Gammaproteobacteria bacterium]|nr:SDR family oxidoreductase [Gammaproteobacteria bacterium]